MFIFCLFDSFPQVLFQKVTKEVLARLGKGQHEFPVVSRSRGDSAAIDIATCTLGDLLWLFVERERRQLTALAAALHQKLAGGSKLFDVWMLESSDEIQSAAMSFGSRVALQQSVLVLQRMGARYRNGAQDQRTQRVLTQLMQLYALRRIEIDLPWFLTTRTLDIEQGAAVSERVRQLCREIAPFALPLVKGFGIPAHLCIAPIAADWVEYNRTDNRGEVKNDLTFLKQ